METKQSNRVPEANVVHEMSVEGSSLVTGKLSTGKLVSRSAASVALLVVGLCFVSFWGSPKSALALQTLPDQTAADQESESAIPPALEEYQGRLIAQTMHYRGAPWLVRENREREERCSLMLANSGIQPGMSVCDIGCGNGYYAFRMAELVGPNGIVYAVDIQPEMLSLLREEMEKRGVENIVPILGSVHNPRLPAGSVDIMVLADVYHEFSHPEQMLKYMRSALKPDGYAILLEYREEDEDVPIKPLHKMSKDQIMKEWPVNGFKLIGEFNRLSWQHMMKFSRDDSERDSIQPAPFSK